MQSDLHKIIVSPQALTPDHVKVFVYQILRGLLSDKISKFGKKSNFRRSYALRLQKKYKAL